VSSPQILTVLADFKTPLNLTLTIRNKEYSFLLIFTASSILFYYLLVFFLSYQSILLYTRLLLTLCPVTILPLATPLTFCISYQMLLTSLIPKHMYSYISENNLEPSNQIIVPTGYSVGGLEQRMKPLSSFFVNVELWLHWDMCIWVHSSWSQRTLSV